MEIGLSQAILLFIRLFRQKVHMAQGVQSLILCRAEQVFQVVDPGLHLPLYTASEVLQIQLHAIQLNLIDFGSQAKLAN